MTRMKSQIFSRTAGNFAAMNNAWMRIFWEISIYVYLITFDKFLTNLLYNYFVHLIRLFSCNGRFYIYTQVCTRARVRTIFRFSCFIKRLKNLLLVITDSWNRIREKFWNRTSSCSLYASKLRGLRTLGNLERYFPRQRLSPKRELNLRLWRLISLPRSRSARELMDVLCSSEKLKRTD